MNPIKTDPVKIKNPTSILSFYLQPGGNARPHWQSMTKERMLEILEHIQPKLTTEIQASECQNIINQLNQI